MAKNIKYWIITDTHFGHTKLHDYCNRPIGFEKQILQRLDRIRKTDILIHLGDICIGNDAEWHCKFMECVVGKKWLLKGNHDRKSDTWYLTHGWDMVAESITLKRFGLTIALSHKPLIDNGFDINIHGHFHNSPLSRHEEDLAKIKNYKYKLIFIEHEYVPIDLQRIITKDN